MSRRRSTAFSARLRAPRGGGGRGAGLRLTARFWVGFLAAFRSGKQAFHSGGDAAPLRAPGKARRGDLHDLAEALRPLGVDLRDHAAQLTLQLFVIECRRQIAADELGLLLLLFGGGRPAAAPERARRLFA